MEVDMTQIVIALIVLVLTNATAIVKLIIALKKKQGAEEALMNLAEVVEDNAAVVVKRGMHSKEQTMTPTAVATLHKTIETVSNRQKVR